ncbi:SNF2-related protein [Cordyceps fumosorosea ARSEF 2679]|uniref:SNF2-related protein n=1 Tax=Cordyceps fumosorosea (strain ARSEF 2679) TaxID=1081104 RepID=A0A168CMW5_CORFA|nr:SNF2-related protein [Cordyceps fumosorosea ARSEF 2679]OAA71573.1 SNF2-related protein [Cordyceps fumosorosea ARSEF 2679]
MARTKRNVSVPIWKAAANNQFGFNDILPSNIVNALLLLPSGPKYLEAPEAPNGRDGGSFAKRRKTTVAPPSSAICLKRGSVSFTRAIERSETTDQVSVKSDVGPHVILRYAGSLLGLRARNKALGLPDCTVLIQEDHVDPGMDQMFKVLSQPVQRNSHGVLWAKVDLKLDIVQGMFTCAFTISQMWNETPSPYYIMRSNVERKESQAVIDAFFPYAGTNSSAWSPMDFYEAAHVPSKEDPNSASIEISSLEATLFPYQKRTVKWLLHREGIRCTPSGLEPVPESDAQPDSDTFRQFEDAEGNAFYLSDVFHVVTRNKAPYWLADRALKGGILAEEMGLGKTLEIIGLILLNQRQDVPQDSRDFLIPCMDSEGLLKTRATLIVTPESLRQQWITEIARHAPSLRVIHYQGCRKLEEDEESKAVVKLAAYDVVITTYSVLSQELHFATDPPERSRRFERAYRRPKSPLVQISWWRVCLDEAQMIESGVSQAASVARVIPRINAWGITGTPVKDDVKDLFGLLLFLRYHPYCYSNQIWTALISFHKPVFQKLFRSLALRHTKALVRDEILLPPQKRFVISMPFSAVEEQHYQSLFKNMAEDCELSLTGAPLIDDWDPEEYEGKMRTWLTRLRQTALHPEVGVYSRRLLGYNKERPMRTIEEVLNAMLEQSEVAIRNEERAYLSTKLTRGQLFENSPRVKEALAIWEEVHEETAKLVDDARATLASGIEEVKNSRESQPGPVVHDRGGSDSESESDVDVVDTRGKISELQRRLRSALEIHHKAVFFCANANFQMRDNAEMTEPDSEEFHRLKKLEDDGYETAKVLRREILQESYRKANRHMSRIKKKANNQTFVEVPELVAETVKGIESGRVVDRLEVLYEELNEQANIMDEWREQVVQLLLRPLLDEEDDIEFTGEELVDSAKFQDDLMVYVQALRSVIADRQDAISGQTNELVKHETETSTKLAENGGGPAPEKMLALLEARKQMKPHRSQISMRGAIGELRGLQTRLNRDAPSSSREAVEHKIVSDHLKHTQALLSQQNKAATALESEIESFKDAMNARLEYYRQLQVVSDAVLPYEGEKTARVEERINKLEQDARKKLLSSEAKHRYLMNLKESGEGGPGSKSNEPRMCIICQTPFVTGVLTVCGHQFCKECMMIWYKSHRNCPVCKRQLKPEQLHDISIKPQQLQILSERGGSGSDKSRLERQQTNGALRNGVIYSEFNADKLAEIKNIDLDGPSFTTKVDTLVRHLLWLRESDPGAKSIIFSQYRDFLTVLHNALRRFRIGFASIDEPGGIARFKGDPAAECFLLHARAHSSGLNLVNASHVFLCEPLLHTALELQAIARVDRIGQLHETTVWLYLVSGTVEESIYNLSVRRRMEHMGQTGGGNGKNSGKGRGAAGKSGGVTPAQPLDASIEQANTLELEHAALSKLMSRDRSAGEMVDKGDLWECLFGNVQDGRDAAETVEGDDRFKDRAVMSYLAAEAAGSRVNGQPNA